MTGVVESSNVSVKPTNIGCDKASKWAVRASRFVKKPRMLRCNKVKLVKLQDGIGMGCRMPPSCGGPLAP